MRLIDADAFEKFIEGKYKDGESTDDIKDQMLFDLSYQPTAYDVGKVVEQVEDKREEMLNDTEFDNNIVNHYLQYADEFIDIVRNGGKE